ncbi:MAG: class I SAM-dependent methyltransferase [Candidatus Heimdallarchaeaceae archaeon]
MNGKEEIAVKGYMEGKYVIGQGKAHKCCRPHKFVFNCQMFGTFNVKLKYGRIDEFQPSVTTEKANYYFLKIKKAKNEYFGWAIRDHKSNQAFNTLEIITKERLPDALRKERFAVTIYDRWNSNQIKEWASKQYWFQTFPFSPKKRADSELVWSTINIIPWTGMKVVDIGAHYGFFSFKAAENGAIVTGVEPNKSSLKCAIEIRNHIIQQDVKFVKNDPGKTFDIILYLSVHHQIDPCYKKLEHQVNALKDRTNKYLFVELILPPLFPKDRQVPESEIDRMVQMTPLKTYDHTVRGRRKIYVWSRDGKIPGYSSK